MEQIPTTTIGQLFKGQERTLALCLSELAAGLSVAHIAEKRIKPVLSDLEANAGTPMDPTYIGYCCQYTLSQTQP
jgi:hypothetical protein